MGAISDLAKSGLNTNRAYHIRICLDSCGFLHDERCLYVELINNVFCLARAGGEVRSFLKVRFPLFTSKVNYRNHRKIVVIDGRVGFVGGMNLAERYMRGFSWQSLQRCFLTSLLYSMRRSASRFQAGGYGPALVSLPNLHRRNAMI